MTATEVQNEEEPEEREAEKQSANYILIMYRSGEEKKYKKDEKTA